MSDAEIIAELRAQIQRQSEGAMITSNLMKLMEEDCEKLRKENQILRDGVKMLAPVDPTDYAR